MNVLVTDRNTKYDGWLVCRSLRDVSTITGNLNTLVFNKSDELTEDKITYLKGIHSKQSQCKFVYLCSEEDTDSAVKMFIIGGLKGRYIDDEFFMEDVHELNGLITELPVVVDTDMSSSKVLDDFFNRYMQSGETGISKGYLQVVKNAASEMVSAYQDKSLELIRMSQSASEIFSNSVDLVANMKERQRRLEKDLKNLKDRKEEVDVLSTKISVVGSPIMYFPRVTYLKSKKILRFKEIGNTPYIVSFFLGFRLYLERVKVLRPKLIVIENQGAMVVTKYKKYDWVTHESKSDSSLYYSNVVFTNCPTSNIVAKMLDDTNFDTFIVLDRTNNYKEHILNTKGKDYVVSLSNTLVSEYKIQKAKCISVGKSLKGATMEIPIFANYPEREDQRVNMYLRECEALYELLCMDKG